MNETALQNLSRQIFTYVREHCESPKPSTRELGSEFCRWCLEELFGLTDMEAEEAMQYDGPNDNSIDAAFTLGDDLYVVQTKFGTSHSKDSMLLWLQKVQSLQRGEGVTGERSEIHALVSHLEDALESGRKVTFLYITSSQFNSAQISVIKHASKYPTLKFVSLSGILDMIQEKALDLPEEFKSRKFSVKIAHDGQPVGDQSLVVPLPIGEIYRLVQEAGDNLYVSNIRSYLRRTKVNKSIEKTLMESPDKFWFYNNGITIVCEEFGVEGNKLSLKAPQIVNGCQTASSINLILQRSSFKKLRDSKDVLVLVRVFKGLSAHERNQITQWTNSQNSIKGKDFLSLQMEHKTLHERLKSKGYYYELRRGAFHLLPPVGAQTFTGNSRLNYLTPKKVARIPATEAIQGYIAAIKGKPHIAYGRLQEVMPFGAQYDEVFPVGVTLEPQHFLYPFLISQHLVQVRGYGRKGLGHKRYSRWLFNYAFFGAASALVAKAGLDVARRDDELGLSLEHLDMIFEDEGLTLPLISLVDEVLQRYFADSTIKRAFGQNAVNFFKAGCATDDARHILYDWIQATLEESDGMELLARLKRKLPGIISV